MDELRIASTATSIDEPARSALLARARAYPHWRTLHGYLVEQGFTPNEPAAYAAWQGSTLVRHVVIAEYLAAPDKAALPMDRGISRKATLGFYVEEDGQMGAQALLDLGGIVDCALQVTDTGIEKLSTPGKF